MRRWPKLLTYDKGVRHFCHKLHLQTQQTVARIAIALNHYDKVTDNIAAVRT